VEQVPCRRTTLRSLIDSREIGEPNHLVAYFGMRRPVDPNDRHFDPMLGGGGLLDLGVYPVQQASLVFGPPSVVHAAGHIDVTGVDEQVAAVLGHPNGSTAVVQAALRVHMTLAARLSGTDGVIELPRVHVLPRPSDRAARRRAASRRHAVAG
jgi:predicted dehydrogenase